MHFSLVYKELKCVDLKEKNRKQMCDQIKKKIQFTVQKNKDAIVYRVQKKESKILSNFKLMAQKKKQDHLKIVLTCNTANCKDIQQNFFFLF